VLTIDVSRTGAEVRVSLSGRLTIDSSPELRTHLLAVLHQEPPPAITVDMERVAYMDSSGLVTLIEALKIARSLRTTLTVKGLKGPIVRVLRTTGLLDLFEPNGTTTAPANVKVQ
jgi:anti-sigma B factor antagonist